MSWSLAGLRREWNRRKDAVAPWWGGNSKEAYNTGLDASSRGLEAWSKSKKGQRGGRVVGFPSAGTAAGCEAFTPHQHPLDRTGTASPEGEAA
jgi:putative transposase